jgi:PAS domain-containing protein
MFSNSASDLLGLIADAIIGIDRDGVIVFWGSGAEAMLGYAPDETVGRVGASGTKCRVDFHGGIARSHDRDAVLVIQ